MEDQVKTNKRPPTFWDFVIIIGGIMLFFLAVDLLSVAFNRMSEPMATVLLRATDNPFVGLFMGLLLTATIQSSSTTTATMVAVVATGSLSLDNAIPMIIGANIGTTLTSTIVSLGYITKRKKFKRAIAAGTVHDFFNILVACLIFPLEYYYGFLTFLSTTLTDWITPPGFAGLDKNFNMELVVARPLSNFILDGLKNYAIAIVFSFFLLFFSIKILSTLIYKLLIGGSKDRFKQYLFSTPLKSFGWGTLLTALVQSSSITTALSVPLVATGKISLKKLFPYIMGANIGTTLTALLAAIFKSEVAIALALAHFLFNCIGVLIFLPFTWLRNVPVHLASAFGRLTMKYRIAGFIYIVLTFFLLPFLLIYFSN